MFLICLEYGLCNEINLKQVMKIIFLKIYNLRKIEKTINDDTKLSAHDLELYARTLTKTRKVIACIII